MAPDGRECFDRAMSIDAIALIDEEAERLTTALAPLNPTQQVQIGRASCRERV